MKHRVQQKLKQTETVKIELQIILLREQFIMSVLKGEVLPLVVQLGFPEDWEEVLMATIEAFRPPTMVMALSRHWFLVLIRQPFPSASQAFPEFSSESQA